MGAYLQNPEMVKRVEVLERQQKGDILLVGSRETLAIISQESSPIVTELLQVLEDLNRRAGLSIVNNKFLTPTGGIYDPSRPCQVLMARDRQEFLSFDNSGHGPLPDWVGVCGRIYGSNYFVLCNLEYVVSQLNNHKGDFEREMGHELEHPWGYQLAHKNYLFYTDYQKFPLWLQEGLAELLGKQDDVEVFHQMLAKKSIVPLDDLNNGFFVHDSDPTDKNICYKECRWFLDYVAKRSGGLDPILEAISQASGQNTETAKSFSLLTGYDLKILWQEWKSTLPVYKN